MLSWYCVSSGVEYCSRKNLLLANCWRKLKRISFLHWSYDRIWRRLLRIRIRIRIGLSLSLSWNYQWLSCIFRRLQEFWPWLGRLQGARWRTPTCLDGCCCLPSCQNQSWDTDIYKRIFYDHIFYRHISDVLFRIYQIIFRHWLESDWGKIEQIRCFFSNYVNLILVRTEICIANFCLPSDIARGKKSKTGIFAIFGKVLKILNFEFE